MKWKDVQGSVLITLLVVAVVFVIVLMGERGRIPEAQAQEDMKTRIEQYEIIAEEQRLITEILKLRYEAALIQQKFNPAPQPAPPTRPVVEPPQVKE